MKPATDETHSMKTGAFSWETPILVDATRMDGMIMSMQLAFVVSALIASSDAKAAELSRQRGAELPAIKELPDPFLQADGQRVQSKQEWLKQSRALLELVLRYEYGNLPPVPHNLAAEELATKNLEAIGANERTILLTMGPDHAIRTHLNLTVPIGKGPFPAIVCGDLGWGRVNPNVVEQVVKRGYVLAEFNRVEIAPDSSAKGGVYAAYPDYEGGRLAAWAWGYHRVIDHLFALDMIDNKHIAITGHSRGGKATLLAGTTDERIALTAPNNSGCGGAGCYRLQAEKSEDIAAILKNFPFWFEPHFGEFIGRIEQLPIDQHIVKALVAPRSLVSTEALDDLWANPKGTQQTYLAAKEVYEFIGAGDRIGIHFRTGNHAHTAADWTTLLDFADQQFFCKKVERRFDHLAFPAAPKAYSWMAPGRAGSSMK